MARGRMRSKIPALVQVLTGNFGEHHLFLCRLHLTRIDELSTTIEELSARIDQEIRPFVPQIEPGVTIPGVQKATAEIIIAETGTAMTRFRTPANLASWAGVCPGHHESAGIHRSGKRRHGDRWLGGAPGTAAMAPGRTREHTYLGARYARLVPRPGQPKTIVDVEHSILTAVWHMLTDNVDWQDLGGYFTKQDPERAMRRLIREANASGVTVRLAPIPDVA
jgi:transposase